MKKILISLIAVILIALVGLSGWYLYLRNPNIPVGKIVSNILPFGSGDNTPPTTNPSTPFDNAQGKPLGADEFSRPTTNLLQISAEPVAGAIALGKSTSTDIVRYVDRATGHIYDVNLTTLVKTKIANQTLPKVYEAYFKSDGSSVLLRFLKDNSDMVENLVLTLTPPKVSTASTLYTSSSTALRQDIGNVAVGPGNTLFYTTRNASSSIVTSTFNGAGIKTLLTSPFKDWRISIAESSLIVYTKASANAAGYAYTLNASTGALTKILGPLNGLVAITNPTNSQILYSYVEEGRTKTFARNLKTSILSEIIPTLAEKCIWSIKNTDILYCAVPDDEIGINEPDNWYRGLTNFSDRIWILDTKVRISQVLVEPKPSLDVDIDAVDLKLTPDEKYLVFINKTDLSLWALKIEGF